LFSRGDRVQIEGGTLNLNANKVTNVGAPTIDTDAVRLIDLTTTQYVTGTNLLADGSAIATGSHVSIFSLNIPAAWANQRVVIDFNLEFFRGQDVGETQAWMRFNSSALGDTFANFTGSSFAQGPGPRASWAGNYTIANVGTATTIIAQVRLGGFAWQWGNSTIAGRFSSMYARRAS
jgi:hypothetical protein